MKEKIKNFVLTKGWLMVLTGIATFFLTTFAFWVAMAVLFPLFVVQAFLYTKWS
jgi:uncharacterized membrane protein YdbT with pleckstrin-like domain